MSFNDELIEALQRITGGARVRPFHEGLRIAPACGNKEVLFLDGSSLQIMGKRGKLVEVLPDLSEWTPATLAILLTGKPIH